MHSKFQSYQVLNKSQLLALPDGADVWVRLQRLYYPDPAEQYTGLARLNIIRHQGKVSEIEVVPQSKSLSWATYYPDMIETDGECVTEDYGMYVYPSEQDIQLHREHQEKDMQEMFGELTDSIQENLSGFGAVSVIAGDMEIPLIPDEDWPEVPDTIPDNW